MGSSLRWRSPATTAPASLHSIAFIPDRNPVEKTSSFPGKQPQYKLREELQKRKKEQASTESFGFLS